MDGWTEDSDSARLRDGIAALYNGVNENWTLGGRPKLHFFKRFVNRYDSCTVCPREGASKNSLQANGVM